MRRRERHAERAGRGEQAEHRVVSIQLRTGRVTPRVALPLLRGNAEFAADALVHPLRGRLGGFHRDAVRVERLGIFAARLQRLEPARRGIAHGHHLHGEHVGLLRFHGTEIVGEAEVFAQCLAGEGEARDLAPRSTIRGEGRRVVHDELVPARLHREVSVYRLRRDPSFVARRRREPLEGRREFLAHGARVLIARPASAPLQPEQFVQVEQREHLVERDVAHHAHAEEGRGGHRDIRRDGAACGARAAGRRVLARGGVQEDVVARLAQIVAHRAGAARRVHEALHGVQPLERVLAIEDARRVGPLTLHEERTATEAAVDRRAADEHGHRQPRRSSSCTHSGICFEVETSSAESPTASALCSTAASTMRFTGTCLPRSTTV